MRSHTLEYQLYDANRGPTWKQATNLVVLPLCRERWSYHAPWFKLDDKTGMGDARGSKWRCVATWVAVSTIARNILGPQPVHKPLIPSCRYISLKACKTPWCLLTAPGSKRPSACRRIFTRSVGLAIVDPIAPAAKGRWHGLPERSICIGLHCLFCMMSLLS